MKPPHLAALLRQQDPEFVHARDAIATWCERACTALFVLFLLANAAGIFD